MGLDVTLYERNTDITAEEFAALRKQYDVDYNAYWELPEEERKATTEPPNPEREHASSVWKESEKYPDHGLFTVGYMKSSYNAGGINSVLGDAGLPTLYDIFPHDENEFIFTPNWKESLTVVTDLLNSWEQETAEGGRLHYRVIQMESSGYTPGPGNETEALDVFLKEFEKPKRDKDDFFGNDYGNRDGTFLFDNPVEVIAWLPGKPRYSFQGSNCVYAVTKANVEGLEHYRQSLEIVKETIEYVLSNDDPSRFYWHWSG